LAETVSISQFNSFATGFLLDHQELLSRQGWEATNHNYGLKPNCSL